jgi:hypothetical protein
MPLTTSERKYSGTAVGILFDVHFSKTSNLLSLYSHEIRHSAAARYF